MSITDRFKAWSEALKQFHQDPNAQVLCPECKKGYLKFKDELWPDGSKKDKYMYCEECKCWNVATMNIT